MSSKLNIIRALLKEGIERIDAGNSHITEQEEDDIIDFLRTINDERLSKYQARQLLKNMPVSTFDKLVHDGILPKGKKVAGWKELSWFKKDILEYKSKMK